MARLIERIVAFADRVSAWGAHVLQGRAVRIAWLVLGSIAVGRRARLRDPRGRQRGGPRGALRGRRGSTRPASTASAVDNDAGSVTIVGVAGAESVTVAARISEGLLRHGPRGRRARRRAVRAWHLPAVRLGLVLGRLHDRDPARHVRRCPGARRVVRDRPARWPGGRQQPEQRRAGAGRGRPDGLGEPGPRRGRRPDGHQRRGVGRPGAVHRRVLDLARPHRGRRRSGSGGHRPARRPRGRVRHRDAGRPGHGDHRHPHRTRAASGRSPSQADQGSITIGYGAG